ncbi:protein of unknown function [Cupriavidus taiwanensis]|nr:protein of unknown function [Cupriavidus taiwanensis]SOZ41302.1 protein of unknown function [Cupriavidus taiwanensis]
MATPAMLRKLQGTRLALRKPSPMLRITVRARIVIPSTSHAQP